MSTPPRFVINLSLPPERRYDELASTFRPQIQSLPGLFDVVVKEAKLPLGVTRLLARCCLRRVQDSEEQRELQGISAATGIAMYLLVAFNVLLDLFMGCTSGGVTVETPQGPRMLHFRTLDWGMDPLRQVIVQLDYVREPAGPVVASSITYAGYVGILTCVKPGLSVSLNFRPCHDQSSWMTNARFYFHHLMVLLGFRASISSILRHLMLSPSKDLDVIAQTLPSTPSTAAYLTLCDGRRTLVLEKDRNQAKTVISEEFAVVTNHDLEDETVIPEKETKAVKIAGMEVLVEESKDRKEAICRMLKSRPTLTEADVIESLSTPPVENEETHFATLMDPQAGRVCWIKKYSEKPR